MLMIPKSDDITDLKRLIRKKIFEVERIGRGRYSSQVEYYGYTASNSHSYNITTKCLSFYFDNEFIYTDNDEEISLADLLIDKYIRTDYIDDEVEEILSKRSLGLATLEVAGYTEPIYYEGESYDSKDYNYSVKKIIKI